MMPTCPAVPLFSEQPLLSPWSGLRPPQPVQGAAVGQEPLLKGTDLAPGYRWGCQLPSGLQLQK